MAAPDCRWTPCVTRGFLAACLLGALAVAPSFAAEDEAATPATTEATPAASAPAAPEAAKPANPDKRTELKAKAEEAYKDAVNAYMTGDLEGAEAKVAAAKKIGAQLTPAERGNLDSIRADLPKLRPAWWKSTSSPSNISFGAEIWNRKITANYMPSHDLGAEGMKVVSGFKETPTGFQEVITDLIPLVTWKPSLVNNPNPANGELAKTQNFKLGDVGEVVVWHELGHNYITSALTMPNLIELYQNHSLLFGHLQEFYADLTAIYHTSPVARRAALMLRLDALDFYDEEEPHTRGGHAIGALFLTQVLQNPEKWPSIHLPPSVPKAQPELNTIIYVEEHWDPAWSLEEAKALREMASDFVRTQGDATLRSKGVMQLPNHTRFSLMVAQDRDFQKQRDAWVVKQLETQIKAGKADKLEAGKTYDPPRRDKTRRVEDAGKEAGPRIDIPMP